ncbi:MAG: hypothetical protein WCC27_11690 [Acidobacteriaceae bacterium]
MWILGLIVAYGLYRFFVVWYLTLSTKDRGRQPYYWDRFWYHATVFLIAILLLALSTFLLWRTRGWLAPLPLIAILGSIYLRRQKRGNQLRETIRDAVALDGQLLNEGEPRPLINQRIAKHFLGSSPSNGWASENDDLRTLLKCYILPELGLYEVNTDLALMTKPGAVLMGTQIDELINFYQNALFVASSLAQRHHPEIRK